MQFITKCKNYLTKPLNNCMESGCADVIVVQSKHEFNCSPFYIRVPVTDSFHSHSKVQMFINNTPINNILMELGQQGELYFIDYEPNSTNKSKSKFRKIRLTSEELGSLNLKKGKNILKFRIIPNSQVKFNKVTKKFLIIEDQSNNNFLGLKCQIWLYSNTQKMFVSDIDGTITRSDIMGVLMYLVNSDWTQKNIVDLYQRFNEQDVQPIYLTARSIFTYKITRNYLEKVIQNNKKLPEGPIILNPEGSTNSIKQEFITKIPKKISSMVDIFNVFNFNNNIILPKDIQAYEFSQNKFNVNLSKISKANNSNFGDISNIDNINENLIQPFVAAFGNRGTDAIAYRMAGIPFSHIFIVNEDGQLIRMSSPNEVTSYQELENNFVKYFGSAINDVFSSNQAQQYYSSGQQQIIPN